MHLILTGATGLVGSGALDAMIKMKDVTKISILSRRPVQMAQDAKDPRINVIIHKDFTSYPPPLLDQLSDATGCVWALGISQTQVSKEEYVKITKDYALAAAEAFRTLPSAPELQDKPFHFVFVSGEGVTHQPGAFTTLFARVKGETELALAETRKRYPRFRADAVRPAGVDWKAHAAIRPYVNPGMFKETVMTALAPVKGLAKRYMSPTEPLGRFLVEAALGRWDGRLEGEGIEEVGDTGFKVVRNWGFVRLAGL